MNDAHGRRRHPPPATGSTHRPPLSAEALAQLAALPAGAANALREYLHGDCLILYALADEPRVAYLLSIRHHRQLSFDFARLWPTA